VIFGIKMMTVIYPIFLRSNYTKLQLKTLGSLLNCSFLWIRYRLGGCSCSLMCRFRAWWRGCEQSMGVTMGGFHFSLL